MQETGVQWYEGFECIRLGTLGVSYFWWNRKTRGSNNLWKKGPFVKALLRRVLLRSSGGRVEVSHSATEMIDKDEEIGKIDPLVAVQIETGVVG